MGVTKVVFELWALKAKLRGVLTGYIVAIVTFYVNDWALLIRFLLHQLINGGSIVTERMRDIVVTICLVKFPRGCNKIYVIENLESRRVSKNRACVLWQKLLFNSACYIIHPIKCNWEVRETATSHPKFQNID